MVPDYYAMLGVERGADREALEAALARCQPAWSSGTRNPKNKHTFQSYLDQIPALRQALLGDPSTRAAYDAELAAAQRTQRDRKLDELQRLVRLRAAKGGLTVTDRALLRDRAVALGLGTDDLDRLAAPIPPQPEPPAEDDAPDPPADVFDPTTRRRIRVALEHLRHRDLYDALGLNRDATAGEIADRADFERQRWMRKTQVTAEKTAWLEVISLAQSHLAAPAERARYDRTLALEAEESLTELIEFALTSQSRLDPGTRAALADEAAARGVAHERADRLVKRACRRLGVARALDALPSPAGPAARLLRCRRCSGVTELPRVASKPGTAACRHCGTPLRWDCPACRKPHWVDEPRCPCGFRLEDREPLVRHFEAAQHAYKARDYQAALIHFQRVQHYAPHHAGARKGIDKIGERVAEIARIQAQCDAARASGRLVAARAAAESWVRLVGPQDPAWMRAWSEVNRALHDALALAARARVQAATDPKSARAAYRQCLTLAADLPEAQEGLARCPPDHPIALQAEFVNDRVRLRWTPPEPDGLGPLSFVIVRKAGAALLHPGDGTRIAEVTTTEFEDRDVAPGASVGYAVLSRRGAAESLAAAAIGPLFLLGEATDVRVETESRQVDLWWSPPPGAADVRVVRKRGSPPQGPEDGDRVEALHGHAHDHGLEDDRVYHYGVFAVYQTPDGRSLSSRGVFVSAQPHPTVPPLAAPTLTQERDGAVRLTWREPLRGRVKVLRSNRPVGHSPGERLTAAQAESLQGHWLDTPAPGQALDPQRTPLGICCYTPVTVWAGTWTVGQSVLYSCIPDPSDLRASRVGNGSRVHLRWRWSPQGPQSLLAARAGTPPLGPDDPEALRATVHESEYSRQGYFALSLPSTNGKHWHIAVYAIAAVDGERVVSPGLDPSARTVVPGPHPEVTVSYALRRSRIPGRPWSLTFRTEPAGSPIPPTALVAHPRTVPLSVDDGEIVANFPSSQDGASFPISSRLDLSKHRARVFADPRAEPDSLPPIRLRHPESDGTRA